MLKIICFAGGLLGAAGLSQYPEFSQQYIQRLAGQVDALTQVVADFEGSALRSGLTRTQAFEQMTGTPFLEDRQEDMRRAFTRHAALSDHLAVLRDASAMGRLAMPHRMLDARTFDRTLDDYAPAMPLTIAGGISSVIGFILGWGVVAICSGLIRRFLRGLGFARRTA